MSEPDMDNEARVKALCSQLLTRALEARWQGLELPPGSAIPEVVAACIPVLRGRLDTLETLRAQLIGLKGGGSSASKDARADRQEAWDRRAMQDAATGNRPEYESRGEREARFNLATLEQEREARQVARIAEMLATTEAQVSTMYFGLRDAQRELMERLHYLEWERHMERT